MATRKKTAPPAKAAAPVVAAPAEEVAPASPDEPDAPAVRTRGPSLRIKGLVDRVVEATGGKKKAVKEVVEATLTALGDALSRGEELNLPGFGKTRIARSTEKDGASHMTLKVRRGPHKKRDPDDNDPLAEDGEDS
jgi:nucleoid DNA-binding protein